VSPRKFDNIRDRSEPPPAEFDVEMARLLVQPDGERLLRLLKSHYDRALGSDATPTQLIVLNAERALIARLEGLYAAGKGQSVGDVRAVLWNYPKPRRPARKVDSAARPAVAESGGAGP
jgi:hypothetical protein